MKKLMGLSKGFYMSMILLMLASLAGIGPGAVAFAQAPEKLYFENLTKYSPSGEYRVRVSALNEAMQESTIWVEDIDGSNNRALVSSGEGYWVTNPVWSPESDQIAYLKVFPSGPRPDGGEAVRVELWVIHFDGSGDRLLSASPGLNPQLGAAGEAYLKWTLANEIEFLDQAASPGKAYAIQVETLEVTEIELPDLSATITFSKLAPLDGAVLNANDVNGTRLLGWEDAGINLNDDKYEYCIDEKDDKICNTEWVKRKSTYSGNGDIVVLADHTYYWQVRTRNDKVYANSGTWWSFKVIGPPIVMSVKRAHPSPTILDYVHFIVTFSEPVNGVDKTDFALTTTGTMAGVTITSMSTIDRKQYTVVIYTGTGEGTIRLDVLDDGTIKDDYNDPLKEGYTSGEVYVVDKDPPEVTAISLLRPYPANNPEVVYKVEFSEEVTGVDLTDFEIVEPGTQDATLDRISSLVVTNPGAYVLVTLNIGNDNDTVRLDLKDAGTGIKDLFEQDILTGYHTGQVHTVTKTPGMSFEAVPTKWVPAIFDQSDGWTVTNHVRLFGDVNNDGNADAVGFGLDGVYVALSDGSKFDNGFGNPIPNRWVVAFDQAHGWTNSLHVRTLGDVNGDGNADAVGFGLDGVYVALSNGVDGFNPISKWGPNMFDQNHGWTNSLHVRTVADVNNDTFADAVGFGLDGIYVALSNGATAFNAPTRWVTAFDQAHGWTVTDHVRTLADVDGDGDADAVGFGLDGVYVAISNGSSAFGLPTKWVTAFDQAHGWNNAQHVRTVADVNGDGKVDAVGFGLNGVYVALSDGLSFDASDGWWTEAFDYLHGWTVTDHVRTLADVDGDGDADAIGFGLNGVYITLAQ